jgi:hypothetical protein
MRYSVKFPKTLFCLSLVSFMIFSNHLFAENLRKSNLFFNDTTSNILKVFPANSKITQKTVLTFTIANPQKVTIKIYDVDGREVAYLFERNVPAGTFEILLETKNLKRGMYFCKFFTGERIPMKKMIMVK